MSGEWKPGDVALVRLDAETEVRAMWTGSDWVSRTCARYDSALHARPLVVIDPEDRDEVHRLWVAFRDDLSSRGVRSMQAALRSLVAPPRPEEPQGLGAVVEDEDGARWVLYTHPDNDAPWCDGCASVDYADIKAVRILSEGVTA